MERLADIRLLFQHFVILACNNRPGNVRELKKVAEHYVRGIDSDRVDTDLKADLP